MGVFRQLNDHGAMTGDQLANNLGAEECLIGNLTHDANNFKSSLLRFIQCEFCAP
jgi:hypothetical protein